LKQRLSPVRKYFQLLRAHSFSAWEDTVTKELIMPLQKMTHARLSALIQPSTVMTSLRQMPVQTFAARNMQKEKHNQIIFRTIYAIK